MLKVVHISLKSFTPDFLKEIIALSVKIEKFPLLQCHRRHNRREMHNTIRVQIPSTSTVHKRLAWFKKQEEMTRE